MSGGPPRSPLRTIVRAHLGDHGHTFVQSKPGTTVREALSKAMKLRKLAPETCAVYRLSDPKLEVCLPIAFIIVVVWEAHDVVMHEHRCTQHAAHTETTELAKSETLYTADNVNLAYLVVAAAQ
jgi:hypothetical protein